MATKALVRRRNKRGRPRKEERVVKVDTFPVFVCRDPQGVKLFKKRPILKSGLWDGAALNGLKAVEPKQFVAMYRNARLPARGQLLEMEMVR